MSKPQRAFLGWDVGAWHCQRGASRDALVLLAGDEKPALLTDHPHRRNLRSAYNGATGTELLSRLLQLAGSTPKAWNEVVLAIDAPLGWPDAFRALLHGDAPATVPDHMDANPLLMRATERWLAERGHQPLSAVQDRIGSQSTKGLAFLTALGLHPASTGVWTGRVGAILVTAVEAYPAPCARSDFLSRRHRRLAADLTDKHPDIRDALTCALVAWAFANHHDQLASPYPTVPPHEGWIWVPRDCLALKDSAE